MSLPLHDQDNILHGIKGGWTMRSEIINALLIREAATQRMTMEKLIGYEEEPGNTFGTPGRSVQTQQTSGDGCLVATTPTEQGATNLSLAQRPSGY